MASAATLWAGVPKLGTTPTSTVWAAAATAASGEASGAPRPLKEVGVVATADRIQGVVDGRLHHRQRARGHDGVLPACSDDLQRCLVPLHDLVGAGWQRCRERDQQDGQYAAQDSAREDPTAGSHGSLLSASLGRHTDERLHRPSRHGHWGVEELSEGPSQEHDILRQGPDVKRKAHADSTFGRTGCQQKRRDPPVASAQFPMSRTPHSLRRASGSAGASLTRFHARLIAIRIEGSESDFLLASRADARGRRRGGPPPPRAIAPTTGAAVPVCSRTRRTGPGPHLPTSRRPCRTRPRRAIVRARRRRRGRRRDRGAGARRRGRRNVARTAYVPLTGAGSGRVARDQTPWAGRRRPRRFTVAHRKQSTTWSLTMPTDCMNA